MKALAFVVSCFLATTFIGTAFASNIGPNSFEILSYQDSDYRFLIIPRNATPPKGFEQRDFDDAAFKSGSAAFGSPGSCPLTTNVQTPWPVNSQLLVRRIISIPAGTTQVQIRARVDNDIIAVFFNGTRVQGPIRHDGCPSSTREQLAIDVPQQLILPGPNLVVFQVSDRGRESFFDARILGNLRTDRVAEAVDVQVPLVPLSSIVVNCSSPGAGAARGSKQIATVGFLVQSVGLEGKIKFTQLQDAPAKSFSIEVLLDNKLVLANTGAFPQGKASINPSFGSMNQTSPENQLQTLLAANSALANESVVREVFACINRHMQIQQQAAVRSMMSKNIRPAHGDSCGLLCKACKGGCQASEWLIDFGVVGAAAAVCLSTGLTTLGQSCVVSSGAAAVATDASCRVQEGCSNECEGL